MAEAGEVEEEIGFVIDHVNGVAAVEGFAEVVVAGREARGEAVGGTEELVGADVVAFYRVTGTSIFIGEFERSFCG